MQRLPLPGPSSLSHNGQGKAPQTSDFALRDILERWAGSDDTLKVVMMAKAEEDKLKQEVMRLEIRRTELEILREAVRAGIQPHLIPQMFSSNASNHGQPLYTPTSPTQAASASNRGQQYQNMPPQIPPYNKQNQPSPRYLPKLDTANLAQPRGQLNPATTAAAVTQHEQRHASSQSGPDVPHSAPVVAHAESDQQGALFFHHWQPPTHGGSNSTPGQDQHSRAVSSDTPGSPTPRKRKAQSSSQHILNPTSSPVPVASRRSPMRGHARHRSEASALGGRFTEHYNPAPPSHNGVYSARMSNDRELPSLPQPQMHQNPTSLEIDAARKRKRSEAESIGSIKEGGPEHANATIEEESATK